VPRDIEGLRGSEPSRQPARDDIAVEAAELTKTFGDFVAVDHVSFAVRRSEVFGFLGPNGAGKTTTIKMLNGLLLPTSGRGRVAGFDVMAESERIKQSIGYMSQLFSLYADLTVEENIAFFSGLYGVPRQKRAARRDWVLEMAGLGGQRRRLTGELALGWKQRLALGCAVLHEPPILFLDEPTSGVDPLSRRAFWDLIYSLAAGGTTVFVTTHYMEEADHCHRLALMNRGKLIALDTPARLRENAREPLLEVQSEAGVAAAAALAGAPGVLRVGLFGRTLHVAVEDAARGRDEIARRLGERGLAADSIAEITPSLEDVFSSLVAAAGGAPVD
jgi:drug efflux transport system ATP-binding protein